MLCCVVLCCVVFTLFFSIFSEFNRIITKTFHNVLIYSQTALAKVVINVEDVNDNKPEFPSPYYRVKLPLMAPVGYSLLHLIAFDLDSDVNSEIRYNITEGNRRGIFRVAPETGVISLTRLENEFLVLAQFICSNTLLYKMLGDIIGNGRKVFTF